MNEITIALGPLLALAAFAAGPTMLYAAAERRGRAAWRALSSAPARLGSGAYRSALVPGLPTLERAPGAIRQAAYASFVFAAIAAPVALLGAVAVVLFGLGLFLALPGAWLAWRACEAGFALLRADPDALEAARGSARHATFATAFVPPFFLFTGFGASELGLGPAPLTFALAATGLVALVISLQALLLHRAARELEALGFQP